jgi:hypothetical protein
MSFWGLFQAFSILTYIALVATVFWFAFAVGVPLRRWLERELGEGAMFRSRG